MTTYYCKCGRVAQKSTNAETTGNRDTADCKGCPYLMPYGPNEWNKEQKCFVQTVVGYQCRMTDHPVHYTSYATGQGGPNDKTVMHVQSLDFDFLQTVTDWVQETFPAGELTGGFDREHMRAVEFFDGYRITFYPAQNKKGIAAKQQLFQRFFHPDGTRLDMTPEEEKAKVLADIEKGKTQRKENTSVEKVYKCVKGNLTGVLYKIGIIGEAGNADRSKLTIKQLGTAPGSTWRRKSMAPEWSVLNQKDAEDGLNTIAEQEGWELASDEEIMHTQQGRPAMQEVESPTSAPTSHADAGEATQSLSAAGPAPLEAQSSDGVAFDYSGLDEQTISVMHIAENEIREARQGYILRVSAAVAAVHEELVAISDKRSNQYSDSTFSAWCTFVGIKRDAAYRFLQVNQLLSDATTEEQAQLEQASPSLLYAAAKPSAPAELVQAVKDGDITTHKEYQAAMARIKQLEEEKEYIAAEAAMDRKKQEDANAAAEKFLAKARAANDEVGRLQAQVDRAEKALKDVTNERNGARQALQAAKMRGDRYKAELNDLKAQPIEAAVVDADEIERRAQELAEQTTARLMDEHEDRMHDTYDQVMLALRAIGSNWTIAMTAYRSLSKEMQDSIHSKINEFASKVKEDVECL